MDGKKPFFQRVSEFLAGKGFYIVLFVCVAVIGASAWILLSTDNLGNSKSAPELTAPPEVTVGAPVSAASSSGGDDASAFAPGAVVAPPSVTPYTPPSPTPSESPSPSPSPSKPSGGGKASAVSSTDAENGDDGGALSFVWPVIGDIEVGYAVDALVYDKTMGDWRVHPAIDITGAIGTKVMAVADGVVKNIYNDDLLGTTVVIEHKGGLTSSYSNLAGTPTVKIGDKVTMGAVIGAIGDTALGETNEVTHLHLAMSLNGSPVDPGDYLPKR